MLINFNYIATFKIDKDLKIEVIKYKLVLLPGIVISIVPIFLR